MTATAPGKRKARIEKGSLKTGATADGFFFGNDVHSVTEIWDLRADVLRFMELKNISSMSDAWPDLRGNETSRKEQNRLRCFRLGELNS